MANETNGDLGNAWLRKHSAGTGAYRLTEWLAADRIVLDANSHASIKPKVPRLVIRHVADSATQLLLLQKGDVDIARDLGSDQLKSLAENKDYEFISADSLNQTYMTMNMALPQFQNKKVLQAIKWAVDYDAIAKNITANLAIVTQSFLPKGMPFALNSNPFKKDVAKAKSLLAEAGYADGFSATLDHFARWPYSDIAQAIQADLAEVGIKVSLLAGENNQVSTKSRERKHEMAILRWTADYLDPNALAQIFCVNEDDSDNSQKRGPAWRSHYVDKEVNDGTNAAAVELDVEKRAQLYRDVQERFLDGSPFAFLLQHLEVAAAGPSARGFHLGAVVNYTRYDGISKS